MRRRVMAAILTPIAVAGAATVAVLNGSAENPVASPVPAAISIAPLPEQRAAPPTADAAAADLERCIAEGSCVRVATDSFSTAFIEIFQESSEPPALHVRTSVADAPPTVWSLEDEHSATYQAMTCGLANCLLEVVVGPETRAAIDMRLIAQGLTGYIEGAAVGSSLSTEAVDLNADGVLDMRSTQHLVQADGTELTYHRTYVNQDRTLVSTGCTLPAQDASAPQTLQTRTCPAP